jgi:hypothetical protein
MNSYKTARNYDATSARLSRAAAWIGLEEGIRKTYQ